MPAIDKTFDYLVPDRWDRDIRVGTMVRVQLHGRRVGGWVVADRVVPPDGVTLKPLAKVTGWGPANDLIGLAEWAAFRWAGRPASFLKTASPLTAVRGLPPPAPPRLVPEDGNGVVADAFNAPNSRAVLRLPPAHDVLPVVLAAARRGRALVITPSLMQGGALADRLRALGLHAAVVPRDWARAAAGAHVVIGARAAAWAPCPQLAAVVVIDAHDEGLQQQQAPTWNAWLVAAERARRAGVPCVLVSPCPTLELLAWGPVIAPSRTIERAGWAGLEIVDRRRDDPHTGLYSPRLVGLVREGGRVVCVLNRKGRARLLACAACGTLARCERCGAAVSAPSAEKGVAGQLTCARCGTTRPLVCLGCGSTRLKTLRVGVSRVREELEALAGRPVGEVTAETGPLPTTSVLVGTEAVLHRVTEVDGVAFLDFDQELLAPRYRAAEEALALLARASRLVGGRGRSGRVVVQTRVPQHEALVAALTADPARLAVSEAGMRAGLRLPPETAMAIVSGEAAATFVESLASRDRGRWGVEILGPEGDRWLIKANDHHALSAALSATPRPPGRLRIEVGPLRV